MTKPYNILIPDRLQPPADIEKKIFGINSKITLCQAIDAKEIDTKLWQSCHAVLAWHDLQYTASLLETMSNCKVIVRVGVGYDNIDLKAARKCGIAVCNVPDYGTNDVADHAIAFMIQAVRGLMIYQRAVLEKKWNWSVAPNLRRLTGQTLGIIGFGRIGKAVALRAKAFGIRVIFYDPYVPEGIDKTFLVDRVRSLKDLASNSDLISIHTPLTPETENMIDGKFFDNCRQGVVFINTARGPIVDMDSLYTAMYTGRVSCSGMDVLPKEPPEDTDRLYKALLIDEEWLRGRLSLTPHAAFFNNDSYIEMRSKAAEEALRALKGEKMLNCLN